MHRVAAIDRCDDFEALRREAQEVLELSDRGSGVLRTSKEVVEVLTRISKERMEIGCEYRHSVGRYLGNRAGSLDLYLDDLGARLQALAEEVGGQEVVEGVVRAYQASLMVARGGPRWDRQARKQELADATRRLLDVTERDRERIHSAVGSVLPELILLGFPASEELAIAA